ncbi:hypothetical protein [Actinomadura harenae]|uniref:SMI1/KNR4 family protein n=1 Tax=Actinomadura harenae TaxID=2483351 RepID=A0A3M2LWV6_9ACTN|nr:hypothetical protein [Actinomadura harenae]RMI41606.1 hypothetical protein EBO15_22675 [Actinomadura harenae]
MSDAYSPIPELNLLKGFQDRSADFFSPGFELREYGKGVAWSDDEAPEFDARIISFARATVSGSSYALWRYDDDADLSALPVIFFGDEGDLYVAAHDLRDLFHELAQDDPDDIAPDRRSYIETRRAYKVWLESTFGPVPPERERGPMAEYGWRFADWLTAVGMEDAAEIVVDNLEAMGIDRP